VVSAIFDNDIGKVGTRIGDLVVQDISRFDRVVREQKIQIGVIAVPPAEAQSVSDLMVESGIKVILNYSPAMVRVADDVTLHNTDPVRELLHTLYYLSRTESVAQVQA
jgi:redox-sensing transcriptional repressor